MRHREARDDPQRLACPYNGTALHRRDAQAFRTLGNGRMVDRLSAPVVALAFRPW